MNTPVTCCDRGRRQKIVTAAVGLAALGAVLSGYLWYEGIQLHREGYEVGVALCPETDLVNCREVLLSRYAQWLGVPLAGAGLANYAALAGVGVALLMTGGDGRRRLAWTAGLSLATLGTASGLWLVWVQVAKLGTICYLCDVVHACGLAVMVLLIWGRPRTGPVALRVLGALGLGTIGVVSLAVGQELVRPQVKPAMLVVATQPADAAGPAPATQSQPAGVYATGTQTQPGNRFIVRDGAGTEIGVIDLDEAIVFGDLTAERTVIDVMDFTCHECRHEAGLFREIFKRHPRWFRLVCLIYPNDRQCNPHAGGRQPHVCEIARAALAARKYAPERYPAVQETLYRLQGPSLTGRLAWQVVKEVCSVDDAALEQWQADETLSATLTAQCELGAKIQAGLKRRGLPTLYAAGMAFAGSDEGVADLEEKLTKLIGPPAEAAVEDTAQEAADRRVRAAGSRTATSRPARRAIRSPGPIFLGR